MKKCLKPNLLNLSILCLLSLAITIIYSCRKDHTENTRPTAVMTDPLVSLAKKWYDSTYVNINNSNTKQATQSDKKYLHDWSKKFAPYWSKAKIFTEDGTTFIELPAVKNGDMALLFDHLKDTVNYDFSRSGTMTDLLIIKQQGSFAMYAMTIQADSSYLNGNYSRVYNNSYQKMDTNFTGAVLFHQMDGTFVNGWRYSKGRLTRQLSLATPDNPTVQNNKLKVNVTEPIPAGCGAIIIVTLWLDCSPDGCYTYTTTDIYADCSYQGYSSGSGGSGGSSGSGGTTPPPPCVPPPATTPPGDGTHPPAEAFVKGKLLINVAAPPDGGGTTTPAPQPCPTQTTTVVQQTVTKDPCAEKNKVSAQEANPTLAAKNDQLLNDYGSSPNEYGTSQNLTSLNATTYKDVPITTSGYPDQFTPAFSWDSTNGYTIGFSHDHPSNSAPSPFDALVMIGNANNPNLVAAGASAMQFYQTNVSSTIVTLSGNYVITVNNWSSMQTIYSQYQAQGALSFKNTYNSYSQVYQSNHPNASLIDAGQYALLKMFGNSINLYIAEPGSGTYTPLIIDGSDSVVKKQC